MDKYKYKYQKYINKLNLLMGGDDSFVYLLVSTEFKKTEQKLGKLEDFSKKTSELIFQLDNYLLSVVNNMPNMNFNSETENNGSLLLLTEEIRRLSRNIKQIEDDILERVRNFFDRDDKISIESFSKFINKLENRESVVRIIGITNYNNIIFDLGRTKLLKLELNVISHYIKAEKELEKEKLKFLQIKEEEYTLINSNIKNIYKNNIIKGSEFRAIILNHHFIMEPYIHVAYTVLKYDIIKKKIYVDLFVSNRRYIKPGSERKKGFIPKMFDENMLDDSFEENYALKIYGIIKEDATNINLLHEKLNILNNYIYRESRERIEFSPDKIKLKLQKNMVQYLSGLKPIDDNQTKVKLCDLKILPSSPADADYRYVIENTKRIVEERGILSEKKNYTVIATTIELLRHNEIHEKQGEEDKHAEAILIEKYHRNDLVMNHFKTDDLIYVIRLYHNGNIGCGLPCNRCVRVLHGNGINRVIYSMDTDNFRMIDMDETTYTYTTTGNKLLNIDLYLYDDFIVRKRIRDE
jgi:hypothetical protein